MSISQKQVILTFIPVERVKKGGHIGIEVQEILRKGLTRGNVPLPYGS
jgi:hypothetical protein